jgi:hypothetical protein
MKKYHPRAGSPTRVDYGTELCVGLARFPETAPLAPDLEKLDEQLFAQFLGRLATRKPLVTARVDLRFANYETDKTLRAVARACEELDERKGGPLFKSVFKEGLTPAVKPDGAAQVPATETIVKNLAESAAPGADTLRGDWTQKLGDSLATLKTAAATYKAAQKATADAFSDERGLRNQHWMLVDRIQGQVQAAFPGNPAKQDLVFPEQDDEREEPKAAEDGAKPAEATAGEPKAASTTGAATTTTPAGAPAKSG